MLSSALIRELAARHIFPEELAVQLQALPQEARTVSWVMRQQWAVLPERLAQALAELLGLPYCDLDHLADTDIDLTTLPEGLAREQELLLAENCVITADPCRPELWQRVALTLGKPVVLQVAAYDKLTQRLARLLHIQARDSLTDEAPIVRYVEKLLLDALSKKASDIHFESYAHYLRVRLRIDGLLVTQAELSIQLAPRIVAHLKVLAELDIAERRLPQDGRLQITLPQRGTVDCRLSACPMTHGEKLVLRLLNTEEQTLDIGHLGLPDVQKALFLAHLKKPQGMIVVTGPTGSGKTTTLYTALKILNQPDVNISSVEDPVEIDLPGINQVQVNAKIGLGFAEVLRSFLRQDPDVLMVGEMRDAQTADIAVKAAQTGHLVLSTLHTNSAAEAIVRLKHMGLPAYQLAASLNLIIAQRLMRKLCPSCKMPDEHAENLLNFPCFRPPLVSACPHCQHGYQGRTAIYEFLSVTPDIQKLIVADADAQQILAEALNNNNKNNSMETLYAHGLKKIRAGETSLAELWRVAG